MKVDQKGKSRHKDKQKKCSCEGYEKGKSTIKVEQKGKIQL